MTALLILIPLFAIIAILRGSDPRKTAQGATGLMLVTGVTLALLWQTGVKKSLAFSVPVLSKPSISLSLDFYDGMSVVMVLLSVIVSFAAARSGKCEDQHAKLWYLAILLIAAGALGAFLATDLFFFYAFHELALIPTFLTIGLLGRGDRKEIAWKVTIYLAFGSIVLLAGLLWLVGASGAENLGFEAILESSIPTDAQRGIALFLLVGFGTLVSLFPFHSWAAPAYASAPAPIAMLHAGVLKKFGLYGLLRLFPLVPEGMRGWLEFIIFLLLGNILWVGFVTISQKRLDTLLGNSSVMHMGYIFLAFAALVDAGSEVGNPIAKPAAVLLMFGHGITVAMLFGLADRIERQTGTLELRDLGGLGKNAPSLAFLFGLAAMASIGLPGLANFAGEVMVFIAGFRSWEPGTQFGWVQIATVFALWGVVISAVYMLRAYRCIFQGGTTPTTENATDLSPPDKRPAVVLATVLLVVGLFPNLILGFIEKPGDRKSAARELPAPPSPQLSSTESAEDPGRSAGSRITNNE